MFGADKEQARLARTIKDYLAQYVESKGTGSIIATSPLSWNVLTKILSLGGLTSIGSATYLVGVNGAADAWVYREPKGANGILLTINDTTFEIGVNDSGIAEAKLDIVNSPVDAYSLTWNTSSGKMKWVLVSGGGGGGGVQVIVGTPSLSVSGNLITPTSGKKLRLYQAFVTIDGTMDEITLRWNSGGTDFTKVINCIPGGEYKLLDLGSNYLEGVADAILYGTLSGLGNAQFIVSYTEES